jgi:3-dehydroquinate synthetase
MSTKTEDKYKMDKEDEMRPITPPKPKKKKRKTYKQMMKDLLKSKQKKEPKLTGLGGGDFAKVVQI